MNSRLKSALKTVLITTAGIIATSAALADSNIYTTAHLNLRSGPSTSHNVLIVVPKCSEIAAVDVTRDAYGNPTWVKTHIGQHWGWLSAKFLRNTNDHCVPKVVTVDPYQNDSQQNNQNQSWTAPKPKTSTGY